MLVWQQNEYNWFLALLGQSLLTSFRGLGQWLSLTEEFSLFLPSQGFTLRDLETLPFGIALPIRDAIYHCREQPASDWPEAVCLLIGRQDLSKQACEGNLPKGKSVSITIESPCSVLASVELEQSCPPFSFKNFCKCMCQIIFYIICQIDMP